jgi:hypothetical protein
MEHTHLFIQDYMTVLPGLVAPHSPNDSIIKVGFGGSILNHFQDRYENWESSIFNITVLR